MHAAAPLEIAIRLASEGVPLAAIARAVCVSSESLRDQLTQARDSGRLVALPRSDWAPKTAKDERALWLSRLLTTDRDALALAAKQVFKLTPAEVSLFLLLLQAPVVRRAGDLSNLTSVHIHHLRKRLQAHGIAIATLWGCGYQLNEPDRRRALDLVLAAT